MRANEFLRESPESELAKKLPSLKKFDYDTIDRLMTKVSHKHGISGKKLHDLFVKKYGSTPDTWVKELDETSLADMRKALAQMDKGNTVKQKVYHGVEEYEKEKQKELKKEPTKSPAKSWPMQIRESVELSDEERDAHIYEFIEWCYKLLNIKNPPQFDLSYDTEEAQGNHHTGSHSGNSIWVYVKNRNLVDILRTVIHELTHQRQTELNMIKPEDSYPGSPIEMLADMVAGKYIKVWGKKHPEIFQ